MFKSLVRLNSRSEHRSKKRYYGFEILLRLSFKIFSYRAISYVGRSIEVGSSVFRLTASIFFIRARICKRLRSLGIDSEESISPAYVAWWSGTTNRVVVPARQAGNRFLGFLKGLQIRAQDESKKYSKQDIVIKPLEHELAVVVSCPCAL